MEGVMITDDAGRRILSTYFLNPALASLALDTAIAQSSQSIIWIHNLESRPHGRDDEDEEESDGGWTSNSKQLGGQAVIQIVRNGLRFIAPVSRSVDPIVPLAFLNQLHLVLESYVGGAVTESSLKDHFDIVLELLEEMLASGRPLISEAAQLRELVVPLSSLDKVAATVGIPVNLPNPGANALLASPIPWRRMGIKYAANEIYFDVTEKLSFILDRNGKAIMGNVTGRVECRSRLSGMPDLLLSFTDPGGLEDCAFHSCVRYAKWTKDSIVSFIPPDGAFTLMSFHLPSPSKSLSAIALLPLMLRPSFTHGALGGTFHLTLTSRAPPTRALTNLVIRFSLGKGASGVTAMASGGGMDREGGGAGRWDYENNAGEDGGKEEVVWKIEKLSSTDRPAILSGQFLSSSASKPIPAVSLSFESPSAGFSGLRIAGLKVTGENYSIFKGVRLRGVGDVEVRCIN